MEQGCILDSNVVIYFLEGVLNPSGKLVVDKAIVAGAKISIISKIELLSWNPPEASNIDKVQSFIDDAIVLPLNDGIVSKTIELRKTYRKINLPDAVIAATALSVSSGLITRNTADFSFIKGLTIIDPFKG